jgi:hypothetical protein
VALGVRAGGSGEAVYTSVFSEALLGSLLLFKSVVIVRIDGVEENASIRSQAASSFFFP